MAHVKIASLVVAATIAIGLYLVPQQASGTQQQCLNAWDEAPLKEYCSSSRVGYVSASSVGNTGCFVDATCSITVSVDGEDTTFSLSTSSDDTMRWVHMRLLDACFSKSEADEWTAAVRPGCKSNETDSETAVDEGLTTETEEAETKSK